MEAKEVISDSQCGFIKDKSAPDKCSSVPHQGYSVVGKARAERLPKRFNIDKIMRTAVHAGAVMHCHEA